MAVLNDFEAAGYGITIISEKDYVVLNDVPAAPQVRQRFTCPAAGQVRCTFSAFNVNNETSGLM